MTNIIEKVARAICAAETGGRPAGYMADGSPMREPTWDWYGPAQHDEWRRLARAAIGAMRPREFGDLPEGVALAGENAGAQSYMAAHNILAAMIDAALAEEG